MASSKYKGLFRKKLNSELRMRLSNMKRENACLKKIMAELSRQHSEHNKLVERFLSLATIKLESCQQVTAKDEKIASPSEHHIQDSTSKKQANNVKELQNHLSNALEKNKQWLEYDQQREAYVRAILARMLWLEKQLNEANQARSRQHNEDHSYERERMSKMQEHYERLLQKVKDELEVLREQVNETQQELTITQKWYEERESEVEELKQQLQTEKGSRKITLEDCHGSEGEEQSEETSDLQRRLNKEKRRSSNFQLQAALYQKFMLNCHHADQEKISDLERQTNVHPVLTALLSSKQQDPASGGAAHPSSSDNFTSSPHSSWLNESFLQCPGCLVEYPASDYRELINHLEICLQ
ncbi:hypothetical protein L3Q82_011862 [Scortum barcoo]|uniref:Uncharacterized protein n=1 Tax=Scortum barcoo TaxID=214431 RepID=A0ACB8W610_9TELE|nr:hypothetical protein L3Q82_011862 [Scortum barcoo]